MGKLLRPGEPLVQLAAHLCARAGHRLCRRARGGASRRDEPRAAILAPGGEPVARQRGSAGMAQTASQPAVLLRLIGGPAAGSDRMIQASSKRPGTQAAVAITKNGLHPSMSASAPPEADRVVRPIAASEVSSAYWVAVKAMLHSPER